MIKLIFEPRQHRLKRLAGLRGAFCLSSSFRQRWGGKEAEERPEAAVKNLKIDLDIIRTAVIFAKTEHCGFDKWSMRKEKSIWLVTTDHLEDGLWFREESDFKVGMNYVAVLAASMPALAILAFILMSNHVHFIFFGTREDVDAFIDEFKRRYSQYYRKKYGIAKFLKENGVKTDRIPFGNEEPEKAIAYIQMNSVAANICSHPTQYPWGTGNLFFNATRPKGVRVDSLSERARMKLLHSKVSVSGHWLVGEDGYILPSSYVDIALVEKYFRTPKRMDYFLRNSSDSSVSAFRRTSTSLPVSPASPIKKLLNSWIRTYEKRSSFRTGRTVCRGNFRLRLSDREGRYR